MAWDIKKRHLYIGFIKYFMPFSQAGVFLVKPFFLFCLSWLYYTKGMDKELIKEKKEASVVVKEPALLHIKIK